MKLTRLSQLYAIAIYYFPLFFFLLNNSQTRNIEKTKMFSGSRRALLLRSKRDVHAEKHVRREESDSRGWWFYTELDRIVAGSKLRLFPLSEGYKDCVVPGKKLIQWRWRQTQRWKCHRARPHLHRTYPSCIRETFRSVYTISSLPYESSLYPSTTWYY